MKETDRIIKLFDDLYQGHPWIDVTVMDTLNSLTAEQAATKIKPSWNSIWEILNHLIAWRLAVLQRIEGQVINSPQNNFFFPIEDPSASAWINTLEEYANTQDRWRAYISNLTSENLDIIPDSKPFTRYELIHGILQHDAYHLGQIRLLAKWVTS